MAKKWVGLLIASLVIIAGGVFLLLRMNTNTSQLRLGDEYYATQVMRTPEQLQKGLSGSDSLPQGHAMLFVFPRDNKWGIWMKDMNYAIDIVWLNSDDEVVYVVRDAQPSSYPDTTFTPPVDSRYVIELPSGTIERTGITIGDTAEMPSGV